MAKDDAEKKSLDGAEDRESPIPTADNLDVTEKITDALTGSNTPEGLADFLSPSEVRAVEQSQREIREILENKKVDPELIRRVLRELGTTKDLQAFADNNFVEELKKEKGKEAVENKLKQFAGMMERRNWGRIFNELHEGDTVISFSLPGADFLLLKHLNDDVFNPSVADLIIEAKREKIREKLSVLFPGQGLLRNDYKIEIAKIPKGMEYKQDDLEKMMVEIDNEMVEAIEKLAADFLKKNEDLTDKKRSRVEDFLSQLRGVDGGKKGFRMNYGIAKVTGAESKDKILAVNNAIGTARMSRSDSENYGSEYSEESTLVELESIKNLRDKIIADGNSIADKDGNNFIIFSKNEDGRYAFNRDLLRDARKGKFEPAVGQEDFLKQVILYTKKLNILDFIKPFVYEDLPAVESGIQEANALADKLRKGETSAESDRAKVKEILNSDERAAGFTSRMEFNRRATNMSKAAYISMDVLDLGVDQLLAYEQEIEKINNGELSKEQKAEEFSKASLRAGDSITERLKFFWNTVKKVCSDKKYNLNNKDGLVTGLVGGDELTLAIEIGDGEGQISEELARQLIFQLKDETNSRVIETRASHSVKDSADETDQAALAEAHIQAMDRSAKGAAILKNIEEFARKYNRLFARSEKKSELEDRLKIFGSLFTLEKGKGVIKTNAVVIEENGRLVVANDNNYKAEYENIEDELKSVLAEDFYPEKIAV
ncbi:MAG TPA: hypothetical protein VLK22_04255 [Candidatus Udaeobacter sp.]|nr:hypothetical protein [Candidatus Udaeobacter sp.]